MCTFVGSDLCVYVCYKGIYIGGGTGGGSGGSCPHKI